jgi:hypothetical protein
LTIPVELTWYEQIAAAQVGLLRQIESLRLGKKSHTQGEANWSINIEGALGEKAFAKGTNRYYSGSVNTFKEGGDVGSIQVRTRSKTGYELYCNERDRDADQFVLLIGSMGKYEILGWAYGHEIKQPEHLKKLTAYSRPAYFIPTSKLRNPQELVLGEEIGYG